MILRERYKLTKSHLTSVLNRAAAERCVERKQGYGREGGNSAIYEYLNTKFVHTRLTA